MSAAKWIDKASISLLTLYVTYDAYSTGRMGMALIAAALFIAGIIAGIVVELTGIRGDDQKPPKP